MNNSAYVRSTHSKDVIKNCKKIIITGGVGVGKTTTISALQQIFMNHNIKTIFVPEYIHGDVQNGEKMLNNFLNGLLDTFAFQYYILTYYDRYLDNLAIDDENTVLLFERIPDDSITCFANRSNKSGELSNEQLYTLYKYAIDIEQTYNIPSYFNIDINDTIDIIMIKSDNTYANAKHVFNKCVNNNKKLLYLVCLYNTSEECLRRVHKRGIQSEIAHYTINEIRQFNKHYTNLYSLFISGEKLRFCSIGKLLE